MRRDPPPPPLDPDQALRALRAIYVIASYPFDDEIARHVELFGKRMSAAVAGGDQRQAEEVAREVREWLGRMHQVLHRRMEIAFGG